MEFSLSPFVYVGIFVGVLMLVEGIYLLFFGRAIRLGNRMNRRLTMIEQGKAQNEVFEQLRREMNQHVLGNGIPLYSLLSERARKANIAFTPATLVLIMAALSAAAWVALTMLTAAPMGVRVLVAMTMGVGGVFFWVSNKAKKRLSMIEEQLPDAIDLIVRSLRVGHPFNAALAMAAREVADPLGTEFGLVSDEANYGRDIGEVLQEFADRVGMPDLRFLAVAVSIQQTSGGNLAEILDGLSKVIRARFKLFRRVRAITAEAKWSGMFLSGFPIAAMIMISMLDPNYYDEVKETSMFIPAALVVGAFLVINVLYMRKMVNIKV